MGYEEISIKKQTLRNMAEKVKGESEKTPYHKDEMIRVLNENGGDAYNSVFDVNSKTEMSVNVTRQLIECTGRFLEKAAEKFEELDITIAQEVSNK